MRRIEKGWLLAGMLFGLAIAAGLYQFRDSVGALYERATGRRPPLQQAEAQSEPQSEPVSESASSVELTADELQSIGVETVVVKRQTIQREILTTGRVEEQETGISAISARIGGRVDKLFLNVTGESVTRGQPVASIYSPEIVTAAEEYKLALENRERLSASKEPQALAGAEDLIAASRRRLELWGLSAKQIDDIVSSSETSLQFTAYSTAAGVVTERKVAEGQYVHEGDALFTVTDLSTVWVQAQIFESDIPLIRNGQAATITAPTLAGGSLRGTVSFLQPGVDPQSRTMSARIQVLNPEMRLRPGMFVQVSLRAPLGTDVVAVPRAAVLETGQEKVVYVARENGVFEKRSIEASTAGDEYYAATKGIEPGERVVTQGNFLIDSQTRLTGNIAGMFGGSKAFGAETAAAGYKVTLRSEPSPPKGGSDGMFHVTVADPEGKPVSDAQVQVNLLMPAMPAMGMGEMRSSFNLAWNGSEYAGSGTIAMAGPWTVTVEARRGGQILGVYRSRLDAK